MALQQKYRISSDLFHCITHFWRVLNHGIMHLFFTHDSRNGVVKSQTVLNSINKLKILSPSTFQRVVSLDWCTDHFPYWYLSDSLCCLIWGTPEIGKTIYVPVDGSSVRRTYWWCCWQYTSSSKYHRYPNISSYLPNHNTYLTAKVHEG